MIEVTLAYKTPSVEPFSVQSSAYSLSPQLKVVCASSQNLTNETMPLSGNVQVLQDGDSWILNRIKGQFCLSSPVVDLFDAVSRPDAVCSHDMASF